MKEEIYPEIIATDLMEEYISREEKCLYQYPIVMQYLRKKIDNHCVADYLKSVGGRRIVLYAVTNFTELLIRDIMNTSTDMIWGVCDKNSKNFGTNYLNCRMINGDEMLMDYKQNKFDKIVVCSIFHANAIINDLIRRGVELDDVLTISQVVFWM